LAVGVDRARPFDARGIDGLQDRRSDRARGDWYGTCLLFAIPHDRFRIDIGDTLVDCGVDSRVDLAGAVTRFYDRGGIGTGIGSGSNFALGSLPLAPTFRLTITFGNSRLAEADHHTPHSPNDRSAENEGVVAAVHGSASDTLKTWRRSLRTSDYRDGPEEPDRRSERF
jgi:hypothetical protein